MLGTSINILELSVCIGLIGQSLLVRSSLGQTCTQSPCRFGEAGSENDSTEFFLRGLVYFKANIMEQAKKTREGRTGSLGLGSELWLQQAH